MMCWACDMDKATALLEDSKRVFIEAKTLRQLANRTQAQAYGEIHRAEMRREEDNTICKEQENASETV